MHYIPSHIEKTAAGQKRTGNYYADVLASKGRNLSQPRDKLKYLQTVREKILTATTHLIKEIEQLMKIRINPDGPSVQADDISGNTNADQDLFYEEILWH